MARPGPDTVAGIDTTDRPRPDRPSLADSVGRFTPSTAWSGATGGLACAWPAPSLPRRRVGHVGRPLAGYTGVGERTDMPGPELLAQIVKAVDMPALPLRR